MKTIYLIYRIFSMLRHSDKDHGFKRCAINAQLIIYVNVTTAENNKNE